MLVPIRGTTPEPLLWVQPRLTRREFELRAGSDVVATLAWRGLLGWSATAETAEGRYRLRLRNPFSGVVVVHPGDSDSETAVWRPRFLGAGTVRFAGGRTFRLHPANFWKRSGFVEDETGVILFRLRLARFRWVRLEASVELEPGSERVAELPVLLILAWYARLLARSRRSG
jgi:hypothetical protein